MKFSEYLNLKKVKKVWPDKNLSESLIEMAKKELGELDSFDLSPSLKLKNYYDFLRALTDSFLIKEGYKSYSHEASIVFLMENGIINKSEANDFNNLRELRHDITYRADEADKNDIKKIRNLIRKLLERI